MFGRSLEILAFVKGATLLLNSNVRIQYNKDLI